MASNWCICSWDFSSLLWETIMCVRVSMGCEVCQIWPSSSAPAASADCGCLRLREARFMTQGQRGWTHTKPAHRSVWSARPRIKHVSQLAAVTKAQFHQWCARYIKKNYKHGGSIDFNWRHWWGQASQFLTTYRVPKHWKMTHSELEIMKNGEEKAPGRLQCFPFVKVKFSASFETETFKWLIWLMSVGMSW